MTEAGIEARGRAASGQPAVLWCRSASEAEHLVTTIRHRLGADVANIAIEEPPPRRHNVRRRLDVRGARS